MNNSINFKSLATAATTLSPLMTDRIKLSTDEIISQYPDGITITEFDSITMKDSQYYIATFAEDDKAYINCGQILSKVFDRFVQAFDGDIAGASETLKAQGGLRVKLNKSRTRGGNSITTVTVI